MMVGLATKNSILFQRLWKQNDDKHLTWSEHSRAEIANIFNLAELNEQVSFKIAYNSKIIKLQTLIYLKNKGAVEYQEKGVILKYFSLL